MIENEYGSRGPSRAPILVVGEAYGAWEDREKRPFVGPTGGLLEELLAAVGINPREVRFTNLLNERPPNNNIRLWVDNSGKPNDRLAAGLESIRREIALVQPSLILPLGNYPLHFLTGLGRWRKTEGAYDYTGIGDYRGCILEGNEIAGGRKCLPTYHPAVVFRQYPLKHIVRADLARAALQSRFAEIRRPPKLLVIDPGGAEKQAWLDWLVSPEGTRSPEGDYPAHQILTGDIEYLGSRLLCLGVTRHPDVAVVLRTDREGLATIEDCRRVLTSGHPLCFQNGMFDCSILEWHFDIPCVQYLKHDTMVGMHVCYTEFPKDLGFIGSLFTEAGPWWQHIDSAFWKAVGSGDKSIDEVLPYNAFDTWVTAESMEKMLADELTDPVLMKEYEYEMSLIQPLWEISKRGVQIDLPRLAKLRSQLEDEITTLLMGLETVAGYEVNPNSTTQVAGLLYETLGIKARGAKTKGGKWKMDDTTLAELLLTELEPIQKAAVKMVRKAKERLSLISKFCDIELDDDGRMRCHYDPAKTDTSRLSSRKFYPTGRGANLQNVPRDSRCRAVFIPDHGQFFGYADLKSAESLVVAHITGDREMLRLHSSEYMDGTKDGHKYVASFLLNKPIEKLTKDERYLGKRVRHAGNYTMSWKKLMTLINTDAEETGVVVTAAQSKRLIEKYRQLHPNLALWWNSVQRALRDTHTITTLLGRRRTFYDRPDNILPEAIAFNPQGTVAKALNLGGILAASRDARLAELGFQILLQVHDAIGFQGPLENLDLICERLVEVMRVPIPIARRDTPPYEIEIPVEIQVGSNWGEASESNPEGLKTWHPRPLSSSIRVA